VSVVCSRSQVLETVQSQKAGSNAFVQLMSLSVIRNFLVVVHM